MKIGMYSHSSVPQICSSTMTCPERGIHHYPHRFRASPMNQSQGVLAHTAKCTTSAHTPPPPKPTQTPPRCKVQMPVLRTQEGLATCLILGIPPTTHSLASHTIISCNYVATTGRQGGARAANFQVTTLSAHTARASDQLPCQGAAQPYADAHGKDAASTCR